MSKGKRRERQAAELYKRAGYETFRPQESKWGETDMFGLYDMVAHKPTMRTHWVQVKSNRAAGIRSWCENARRFLGPHSRPLMAVCYDQEGWRVLRPTAPGHPERAFTAVVDERDEECEMGELVVEYLQGGRP